MFVQLPLNVNLKDEYAFESFVADTESLALSLNQFQMTLKTPGNACIYFHGEQGCGKTHMLLASCRFMMELKKSSVYLPLDDVEMALIPDVLKGLEQTDIVCLDNIETRLGDVLWEEALNSLIQKMATLGKKLVLSGENSLDAYDFVTSSLPKSLSLALPVKLQLIKEKSNLVLAIQRHAMRSGFELTTDVCNYLIKQFSIDLQELLSVIKLLEQASIVEKRKITLPFTKKVLKTQE